MTCGGKTCDNMLWNPPYFMFRGSDVAKSIERTTFDITLLPIWRTDNHRQIGNISAELDCG